MEISVREKSGSCLPSTSWCTLNACLSSVTPPLSLPQLSGFPFFQICCKIVPMSVRIDFRMPFSKRSCLGSWECFRLRVRRQTNVINVHSYIARFNLNSSSAFLVFNKTRPSSCSSFSSIHLLFFFHFCSQPLLLCRGVPFRASRTLLVVLIYRGIFIIYLLFLGFT